jgi:hypothetical protein
MNATQRALAMEKKTPRVGDLVVFPQEMQEGLPGFGVGKVMEKKRTKLVCQWMGNFNEELMGTYRPAWSREGSDNYYFGECEAGDVAYTTDHTYTRVRTAEIADTAFALTPDLRVPRATLEKIMDHPAFGWTIPL